MEKFDFISRETSEALDELIGGLFDLNRTTDRMVSIMHMPIASQIIHERIAHFYPVLADAISGIKDRFDYSSIYPETHRDDRDYDNLGTMFNQLLSENHDIYLMLKMTLNIAQSKGDWNVLSELLRFTHVFNYVIESILTLQGKANQMPTNFDTFDQHIEDWGIPEFSIPSPRFIEEGDD